MHQKEKDRRKNRLCNERAFRPGLGRIEVVAGLGHGYWGWKLRGRSHEDRSKLNRSEIDLSSL